MLCFVSALFGEQDVKRPNVRSHAPRGNQGTLSPFSVKTALGRKTRLERNDEPGPLKISLSTTYLAGPNPVPAIKLRSCPGKF
jgi:hypothetical protein